GITLVVGGAFALHWTAETERSTTAPASTARTAEQVAAAGAATGRRRLAAMLAHRGGWLMAATAFLWSLTVPLDKLAIGRASAPFHGLFLTAGGAVGTFAILAARRQLSEVRGVRGAWAPLAGALVASTLELGLQLAAIRLVLVSVVETVKRGLGNLLAVAIGRAVFGEALTWGKLVSVAAMAAGVALILR
ncbi:MAG TPA: hypothetical protein VKY89_17730, partial [Thermoanaerobaculia bacterium]|nr:hypothetical protein [Thermoanaerobaculia bacterium]